MFGPKRAEITGEWRRLHNERLYALYSSPNMMRRVGRVERMGRREEHTEFWWETLKKEATWKTSVWIA
jgi:hypothetical protein